MIIFIILFIIILLASQSNKKMRFWLNKIIDQPYNYYILLGLLIIGFSLRFDYTERLGCIIGWEPFYDIKNILFSTISITFILLSLLSKQRNRKLIFISVELLSWIFKFFLFKGGYAVGIWGSDDLLISFYDTTSLALRLLIIRSLLKDKIRWIYCILGALIIICIKIYIFPLPYSFHINEKKSQEQKEKTSRFLQGKWIENSPIKPLQIIIYSNHAVLYNYKIMIAYP